MMSYLIAVPGIRQTIGTKIFTIKRMYASQEDARKCAHEMKMSGKYREVLVYTRRNEGGNLQGRHPYCVAVWGRK
jgi:hypothetical protein